MNAPRAKLPVDVSIDFMHGYISQEAPEIQFEIIANLLLWFFVEHASDHDAERALSQIMLSLPRARQTAMANFPTVGGMQ